MTKPKKRKPKSLDTLVRKRPTGLDGTYAGTCIACLKPTDTALAFRGEPEWHAAGLVQLGLPMNEAIATAERTLRAMAVGSDGAGRYDAVYRVCGDCAAKADPPFPTPALAYPGMPIPVVAPLRDNGS